MPIFGETSITKLNVDELELTAKTDNGAKKYLLDLIYPIGSIYIYQGIEQVDSCPIAKTLGGTWTQIEDKFLYATVNKKDVSLGKNGGRNNAWFVGHRHYIYDFGYMKNPAIPNAYFPEIELDLSHNHGLETINLPLYSDKDSRVWALKVNESTLEPKTVYTSTNELKKNIDLNRLRGLSGERDKDTIRSNGEIMHQPGTVQLLTTDSDMQHANMPSYTCVLAWKRTA